MIHTLISSLDNIFNNKDFLLMISKSLDNFFFISRINSFAFFTNFFTTFSCNYLIKIIFVVEMRAFVEKEISLLNPHGWLKMSNSRREWESSNGGDIQGWG